MNIQSVNDALRCGNVVLVCGAGISVNPPSTLPEWKALRDETVHAISGTDQELSHLAGKLLERELISVPGSRGLAPEVVASMISSVTPAYFQALTALQGSEPNDNHTVIARAARRGLLRHIISTNWDDLIESALVRENVAFRAFRTNEEFAKCEPDTELPVVHLYKIHGCLTKPDSITARVEDEARGLSEPKALVLRSLLRQFTFLFWGYSGADLKIDLDYLQMVRCHPSAPGFLWNLYADGDYFESPNQYVLALTEIYSDRSGVAHGILPRLLNEQLDSSEQVSPTRASLDEIRTLRQKRTQELRDSLGKWASSNLDQFARLEAMALMLRQAGELSDAARCYERLGALADQVEGRGFRVARASASAMRLYLELGDVESADRLSRRVDDTARTHGDLLLVAEAGLTMAEGLRRSGRFLPALRAFGYGNILLRGLGDTPSELDDLYELGIGDTFADVGYFDLALARYEIVETRARREGRLSMVASVLARRSWLAELQDDFEGALPLLRAADDIARSLGLRREHAVWSLRLGTLEGNLNELSKPEEGSPLDDVQRHNELRDKAVAYAREAGDPLLFMQASLDAAIKRGVAVSMNELNDAEKRLDDVEEFARARGQQRMLLDVAARRVWLRAGFFQSESALAAIDAALGLLTSVGDDGLSAAVLDTKASVLLQKGADPNELLDCIERLAAIERKRSRLYPTLETTLVSLRRELGIGRYPVNADDLRRTLADGDPGIEEFLESVAHSEGFVSWHEWGKALESDYGPDWASVRSLDKVAEKCRELRMLKRADLTINPLNSIVDVSQSWSDHQFAAISANERGLALMTLGRAEEALRSFEEAMRLAVLGKDEGEQLDDWFNAASACEELKRYDEAMEYYERVLTHPRAKKDPAIALEASLRYGEVSKEVGKHAVALTHFQMAEYLARAMNRTQRLLQIVQRLGKLLFALGQYEASIRYRLEAAEILDADRKPFAAANMFWLVANTYFAKLGRPRDAVVHYDRAADLFERANAANQLVRLREDRNRCSGLVETEGQPPMLYALLTHLCPSPQERDSLLLRIAAGMGFNVWQFEPQSFAAYCDGNPIVKWPVTATDDQPIRLPMRLFGVLMTISGTADYENEKGHTKESLRLLEVAAHVARAWSLPPNLGLGLLGHSSLSADMNQ